MKTALRRPNKLAQRLAAWRDSQSWSNAALAEHLSAQLNVEVSPRSVEHWVQGRTPHRIWKNKIEKILNEAYPTDPR